MTQNGRYIVFVPWLAASCWMLSPGCESTAMNGADASREPVVRARSVASARLAQDDASRRPPDEVPAELVGPLNAHTALPVEEIQPEIDDPVHLPAVLARRLDELLEALDANDRLTPEQKEREKADRRRAYDERIALIKERLDFLRKPHVVELSLSEAIRRAVLNNYLIHAAAYGPAIEAARIVEAEAQFDAVFFSRATNNKQDRPSASQLQGTSYEVRDFEAGVRKLLSTGTQVQTSYALNRTQTDLVFQTLNPSYFNNFIVEFRQPFLRGFGLDFNRSKIELAKLDRQRSLQSYRSQVQERIYDVHQAYWWLAHSRRTLGILAQQLCEYTLILKDLQLRAKVGYDVYRAQISQTRSRLETLEAEFVVIHGLVENNESVLKAALNDPGLNLARDDIEIVPTDVPTLEPVLLDKVGEIAEGLASRPDLRETRIALEQAKIGIGVAKNQALPRLDVLFRYIVDGLGDDPDGAFSQLSKNDFHEYYLMVEFEWPIGARAGEAAIRRARHEQARAVLQYRAAVEGAILEMATAIRSLRDAYGQIEPRFQAVDAAKEQVRTLLARQERKDPRSLDLELSAHDNLAVTRRALLDAVVADFQVASQGPSLGLSGRLGGYNVRLADLERKKGTLLRHHNIVIQDDGDESYLDPVRPIGP